MKYFKILFITAILALVVGLSISCERDDICSEITPTTPDLIIDLFDNVNEGSSKNVFKLLIVGVGSDNVLPGYEIVSSNKLILPLKTTENTTEYRLIEGTTINDNGTPDDTSDDFVEGNEDIITINYTRSEVFVSRACGYKTIFENVTVQLTTDEDNWIKSISPINANQSVEDETEAHFNLFH